MDIDHISSPLWEQSLQNEYRYSRELRNLAHRSRAKQVVVTFVETGATIFNVLTPGAAGYSITLDAKPEYPFVAPAVSVKRAGVPADFVSATLENWQPRNMLYQIVDDILERNRLLTGLGGLVGCGLASLVVFGLVGLILILFLVSANPANTQASDSTAFARLETSVADRKQQAIAVLTAGAKVASDTGLSDPQIEAAKANLTALASQDQSLQRYRTATALARVGTVGINVAQLELPTATATPTDTPVTDTPGQSVTPVFNPTPTSFLLRLTPSATATASETTLTPSPTTISEPTDTATAAPVFLPSPTIAVRPLPTFTPTATATAVPTATPEPTETPTPTATFTPELTLTPSPEPVTITPATPTLAALPTPTHTPEPQPTDTPRPQPTNTPVPTPTATATPTPTTPIVRPTTPPNTPTLPPPPPPTRTPKPTLKATPTRGTITPPATKPPTPKPTQPTNTPVPPTPTATDTPVPPTTTMAANPPVITPVSSDGSLPVGYNSLPAPQDQPQLDPRYAQVGQELEKFLRELLKKQLPALFSQFN